MIVISNVIDISDALSDVVDSFVDVQPLVGIVVDRLDVVDGCVRASKSAWPCLCTEMAEEYSIGLDESGLKKIFEFLLVYCFNH